MMRVCGTCSKQWPDTTRFCPIDGTTLSDSMAAPTLAPHPLDKLVGQVINRTYRLEEKIGQGGMGAVFRAQHLGIGDTVALKIISSEYVNNIAPLARKTAPKPP